MGAVNTNSISLAAIRELELGKLPESGAAEYLEPNDIGTFGAEITTMVRTPISKYRMTKKGTITDVTSTVDFGQDTTASFLLEYLEGAIYSHWLRRPYALRNKVQASLSDAGYKLSTALAGAPLARSIVYARGFANQANNGLKVVDAGSTTTVIKTTDGGSFVDETGNNNTSIFVCGYQGAVGDIQVDSNGNLTSTVVDFRNLGLDLGHGIFIGGLDAANRFAQTATYGLCRVRTVEEHRIILDKRPNMFVADTGAGKSIRLFFGWFIKDVAVDDPLFKDHSFAFEVAYPGLMDSGDTAYEYSVGNMINTFELSLPLSDKSDVSVQTFGMDTIPVSGERKAWTFNAPQFVEAYSTPNDFIRLRVEKVDGYGLSTLFKECTLTMNNNAGGENVLGKIGPAFTNFGNFDVSLAFSCVFTSPEIPKMIRNNCTVTMDFCIVNNDAGFYFDVPSTTLGDGSKDFAVNEKVKISLNSNAFGDLGTGYTIGITFFPYIPNPKSDACA